MSTLDFNCIVFQPGVSPGQCWAFVGAKGFLVLKLSNTIRVTGFTMEHLPKSLSEDGHIRSAPKDFSVWVSRIISILIEYKFRFLYFFYILNQGLKHETDSDGQLLGKYQFANDGPSLQYFSAVVRNCFFLFCFINNNSNFDGFQKTEDPFSIIELRIESNHGHGEYTCLYRIRVHGVLA